MELSSSSMRVEYPLDSVFMLAWFIPAKAGELCDTPRGFGAEVLATTLLCEYMPGMYAEDCAEARLFVEGACDS